MPITIMRSGLARFLARDGDGSGVLLAIEVVQPGLGRGRVGQVGLVQYLEARALSVFPHFANYGVAARLWNARIEHFDHDIDALHGLGRFLARRGHMSWEPLDCHRVSPSICCACWLRLELKVGLRPSCVVVQYPPATDAVPLTAIVNVLKERILPY
jgi:hypothetical protein